MFRVSKYEENRNKNIGTAYKIRLIYIILTQPTQRRCKDVAKRS